MRKEAEDNFIQAEADLKTAQDNLHTKNYYAAAFFSQQAAEKALKAFYLWRKNQLPERTHNLVKISLELKLPKELMAAAQVLTPAAVLTRYSDVLGMPPVKFYTMEMAEQAIQQAKVIFQWVKKELK